MITSEQEQDVDSFIRTCHPGCPDLLQRADEKKWTLAQLEHLRSRLPEWKRGVWSPQQLHDAAMVIQRVQIAMAAERNAADRHQKSEDAARDRHAEGVRLTRRGILLAGVAAGAAILSLAATIVALLRAK